MKTDSIDAHDLLGKYIINKININKITSTRFDYAFGRESHFDPVKKNEADDAGEEALFFGLRASPHSHVDIPHLLRD